METGYKGTDRMITGIVFGVITFWLFAQAMVNVVPAVQSDLGISMGTLNIAISVTALFQGCSLLLPGACRQGRQKENCLYWFRAQHYRVSLPRSG